MNPLFNWIPAGPAGPVPEFLAPRAPMGTSALRPRAIKFDWTFALAPLNVTALTQEIAVFCPSPEPEPNWRPRSSRAARILMRTAGGNRFVSRSRRTSRVLRIVTSVATEPR